MTLQDRLFPATVMPDQNWWHTLWPDPDGVVRDLRIESGMSVIDLGCGDGYFTAAIARQLGSGRVVGFDLDPVMLEQAKSACEGRANCDWLLGDAMELSPQKQTCTVLEPAGFKLETLVELPPYHYGAIFRKQQNTKSQNGDGS